jgi:CubicO group peptidase (beta-lactamase class C family)
MNTIPMLITVSAIAAGCAAARAADLTSNRLPRSTPEEQGVSSPAILGFIAAAEQNIDALHSFMLVRHGVVVAEGWWSPYGAEEPHSLFSLSKSFTSTAIGLAVSEGRLGLDDPVLGFFPDKAPPAPSKNLEAMRIRDLLRMSTGQTEEHVKGFPFQSGEDLVTTFLALPVTYKPGTHFVYNTEATYMLSAIITKVTGQSVLDYLRPRLFGPLGIAGPTWQASAQGISFGGFGLSLHTEDIARFGQLYLQRGRWQGRQLVPAAWVDEATSLQTSNGSDPTSDWDQGYGYQFWRCRHGFYRGDGAFGQFCIVMPQYDAVLAMTAGTKDMASVMNLVWDRIIPALKPGPLPADPASDRLLAGKLASLRLPPQEGSETSPLAGQIARRTYVFPANPEGIKSMMLEPSSPGGATITIETDHGPERLVCGNGTWVKGELPPTFEFTRAVAASGAWTADDTYTAEVYRYQTPFRQTYRLRFSGDGAELDVGLNVVSDHASSFRLRGQAVKN